MGIIVVQKSQTVPTRRAERVRVKNRERKEGEGRRGEGAAGIIHFAGVASPRA